MRKEETGRAASGRTIHNMSWQAAGDSRVLGEINAATVLNAEEAERLAADTNALCDRVIATSAIQVANSRSSFPF